MVVEQAPKPREGGYLTDFRGTGIEVAERMGIMDQVREKQYIPKEMLFVDESNKTIARLDIARLFSETFDDPRKAQTQILRSDLAKILYDRSKKFGSLSSDLDVLCLTQSQILNFVAKHKSWLRTDGYATFFLFKANNQFFVASGSFDGDGSLGVRVYRFEDDDVWDADYRRRVVVPQLATS